MGKYNLAVNRLLERKDIFADLINGTIFQGRQELKAEQLETIPTQSGVMIKKEGGKLTALERSGDIRMKAQMGTYSLIIANETQESVDYTMPIRDMLYAALEYIKQIQDIRKKNKQEKQERDMFLSGLKADDRLCPVIVTVFYPKGEWEGHRSLYDLLEIDQADPNWEILKKYIPDYSINLITAKELEHPEWFQTCLRHISSMLMYNKNKEKLYEYLTSNRDELDQMDEVEMMAAFVMLGEQKRVETLLSVKEQKGEVSMCQAIDELIRDGEIRGEIRGEERGRMAGKIEAENRCMLLLQKMLKDGKEYLLDRVAEDEGFRMQMFQQYQL